jgi:glycerol uptake facilitator-like aquaporin
VAHVGSLLQRALSLHRQLGALDPLVVTILAGSRFACSSVPWLVGLCITAAYWFTASTCFADPTVAIARAFTNTFSGIRPADLPGFVAAQLFGAVCALAFAGWLLRQPAVADRPSRFAETS